jgi:hypothetical protein
LAPYQPDIKHGLVASTLGIIGMILFVGFGLVPILEPSGKYDVLTQLYLKLIKKDSGLIELRNDTIIFSALHQIDFPDLTISSDKDLINETNHADDWSDVWNDDKDDVSDDQSYSF